MKNSNSRTSGRPLMYHAGASSRAADAGAPTTCKDVRLQATGRVRAAVMGRTKGRDRQARRGSGEPAAAPALGSSGGVGSPHLQGWTTSMATVGCMQRPRGVQQAFQDNPRWTCRLCPGHGRPRRCRGAGCR